MTTLPAEEPDRLTIRRPLNERVFVRAPTGDDSSVIGWILAERGVQAVALDDFDALGEEWGRGVGVVLIASEALDTPECCGSMQRLLERQEPWSEVPIIVLGGGGAEEEAGIRGVLGEHVHLLILERPVGVATFVTAVEGALRSRRRQYEVKRLLDELAASAVEVRRLHEEADRTKDEFLATLAHELRSPMTAIRGWIQMLKMGALDATQATEALGMIETSTRVQAHIIEDLMDVSRILAGKVMIDPAVIELAPVLANVVATFSPAAALQGLNLTADLPSEPLVVRGDDVRLQQVGWNLISNAIKFTPRGGSVHVSLKGVGTDAVISVRDTGQGISAELLPRVFERYTQEERPGGGGSYRGLGLGLAIVRHLVENHGGTIEVFSEGPGKGAEFLVTLPLYER